MGRPRIYPEGTTATERVAQSTRKLVRAGGCRKTFRLKAQPATAMRLLMAQAGAPKTETELIEKLLTDAAARLRASELSEVHELRFRNTGKGDECWLPLEGNWRTAACNWLVAHDLYHHEPNDKGSLAEELASLGAEYYVCHEDRAVSFIPEEGEPELPPPGLNALARSAAGIIGISMESEHLGAEDFALEPSGIAPLDDKVAEYVFRAAAESAAAELNHLAADNDLPEWAPVREAFEQPEVVASWIRLGYVNAQRRFPEQLRVRQAFEAASKAVWEIGFKTGHGAVLTARRQGYDTTLQVTTQS